MFSDVLCWCLEARGVAAPGLKEVVASTISGHFESWATPSDEEANETCRLLGEKAGSCFLKAPDSLAEWLRTRENAFDGFRPSYPKKVAKRPAADAYRAFMIDVVVHQPSERVRREKMLKALKACRRDAKYAKPLTFQLLSSWQEYILGEGCAGFRSGDAYAKGGSERYGYSPNVEARFESILAGANDANRHFSMHAARVYLDVAFFHPFADGNARSARLALDFVLAREGWGLSLAAPLFDVSRSPVDASGALQLAREISLNVAPLKAA